MPRLLRPLFCRRRELLDEPALVGAEALAAAIRTGVGEDIQPGMVVSIATAGDLVQWHPHLHILATDGRFSPDRTLRALPVWEGDAVMKLFRQRLLDRLVARKAISEELVRTLPSSQAIPTCPRRSFTGTLVRAQGGRDPHQPQPENRRGPPVWSPRGGTRRVPGVPVASGGRLYLANLDGKVVRVRHAAVRAESVGSLDEPIFGTPAISRDRIYIRTPSCFVLLRKEIAMRARLG
jgi:hypothetical protein